LHSSLLLLAWMLSVNYAYGQASTMASLPTLTRIGQIRELTTEEAGRGYPVRIRGVVTYYNRDPGDLFIQDSTAGIWIDPRETSFVFHQGEFVEVEGSTSFADLGPVIERPRFQSLGEVPMPKPMRPTSDELASGGLDSRWIELDGVVRSVSERDGGLVLNVSSGAFECSVFVLKYSAVPIEIIDGEIRVRGVFSGLYDPRSKRFIGFQVLTPSWSDVELLKQPTQASWLSPVRPLRMFLKLTPEGAFSHRLRVRGVVTLQELGRFVCIRDTEGALLVKTTQPTPLKVGDLIEAIGYPALGDYTVIMRDAIFRRVGGGPAPEPVAVNPEKMAPGSHNAELVRLSARLLNCTTRFGEEVLELQAGPATLRAVLNKGTNRSALSSLRGGSLLQLNGVVIVVADENHEPMGFEIRLRSPADVVVLDQPSWWTRGRALLVLGFLAVAVILALGWITALRRRVRKQTEALRAKYERELALEEQYRDLFENAHDLIQCVDRQGRLLLVNPAWRKTLGYSEAEVAGLRILDIVKPDYREQCRELFQRLMSGEKLGSIEVELVSKSGETVMLEGSSDCQFVGGNLVSMRGIFRNVTERKHAEEAQRFLACIVESSDYAIFGTDPEGSIVSWNKSSEALFGYSAGEILGKHVSTLFPPERQDEASHIIGRLKQGEKISHFETTAMRKDGARRPVSLTVSPIKSAAGEVMGAATIAHDISQRKRAELELQKAKEDAEAANRAKSEFLANMSHEIRTPMNGVLGMTELALNTDLTAEQREYLEMAELSADRMMTVINDILDFSKIEAGKLDLDPTPFCVRESLANIIAPPSLRAQLKGLKLTWSVCPEVPEEVVADPTRLAQILGNLLENAIKFTSQGEIELQVELGRQQANGAVLHFWVRDTGIGIPREKQKSIFEAFAQGDSSTSRKFGGTGLGLTISARLVEMMGGRIWVESQPGEGSRFHFTVQVGLAPKPLRECRSEESVATAHRRTDRGEAPRTAAGSLVEEGPKLRILVAEDNAVNQKLVARLLEKQGHSVIAAETGRAVLQVLDEHAVDVVLMDVQMPDMDGFEATAAIREREKGTTRHRPIIAMTAYAMRGDREKCLAAGMDGYVSKPLSGAALAKEIDRVCAASSEPVAVCTTP
jgi:PAS domain S-box-containing protein